MAWRTKNGQTSEPNYDRRGTDVRHGVEIKDYSEPWRQAERINKREAMTPEERQAESREISRRLFSRDD
jgi:hypothetical protein